jgi:hypothetical protein
MFCSDEGGSDLCSSDEGGELLDRARASVSNPAKALPVRRAAEPLVLMPTSVSFLRGDQIMRRIARFLFGTEGKQCGCALHQVARPDQVVAPAIVSAVAPRHRGRHKRCET